MGEFSVVDFGCDGQQFKTSDLIFSRADDPRSHMFRSDPLSVLLCRKVVLRV